MHFLPPTAERVPDVKKITHEMIDKMGMVKDQNEIINDHVAFRTMGVKNLGIASFEKIFLAHGYEKRDFFHFEVEKTRCTLVCPTYTGSSTNIS